MNMETSDEIPFRIETPEAILMAMQTRILDEDVDYRYLYAFARKNHISIPNALKHARKRVEKDFHKFRQEKKRQLRIGHIEVSGLSTIGNFTEIEAILPWLREIAEHTNLLDFLRRRFGPMLQKAGMTGLEKESPKSMLNALLHLDSILRDELLAYLHRKSPRNFSVDELRQVLCARIIFDSGNEDLLIALRKYLQDNSKELFYHNACAELIFSRLPEFLSRVMDIKAKLIRQKLSHKITKLSISSQHKVFLCGYLRELSDEQLMKVLKKIDTVSKRLPGMSSNTRMKLHSYILSIRYLINSSKMLYKRLFLTNRVVQQMYPLYVPKNVLRLRISYEDVILKEYTSLVKLIFYPTKDYLDLYKCLTSDDCTRHTLGEKHLLTHNFFNIRIYSGSSWIGNIYMLDLMKEYGILLLDRIQIPRGINAEYMLFFQDLKEAMEDIFTEVSYKYILLPLKISNHKTIQDIFNTYKERLSKSTVSMKMPFAKHFESLKDGECFYILSKKENNS